MGRVGVPSLKEKGLSSPFAALGRKPRVAIAIICECGGRSKKPAVNFGSRKGKKPQNLGEKLKADKYRVGKIFA